MYNNFPSGWQTNLLTVAATRGVVLNTFLEIFERTPCKKTNQCKYGHAFRTDPHIKNIKLIGGHEGSALACISHGRIVVRANARAINVLEKFQPSAIIFLQCEETYLAWCSQKRSKKSHISTRHKPESPLLLRRQYFDLCA